MFDSHNPFNRLNHQSFAFRASRFEIWKGGKMVNSGNTSGTIRAEVSENSGEAKTIIRYNDSALHNELDEYNEFDAFITGTDRLQLITIPEESFPDHGALQMFRMIVGSTRNRKDFDYTQPYCCNLFTKDGVIRKVTFSFSNPEKLIEFYEDQPKGDFNLDFEFESEDHLRYEQGQVVSGPHGGAPRMVKVEPNISGNEGVTVSIYNLQGNHPLWQNNLQMAPKQMKIINRSDDRVILRGYGSDAFGNTFSDYGMTVIYDSSGTPKKCILHMHDRGVDIAYFKKLTDII